MSSYAPPLHINPKFNVTDYNYQNKYMTQYTADSRYALIAGNNSFSGATNTFRKISGSNLTLTDTTSTPASLSNGTLILKHTTSGGSSSILFQSTVNSGSDYAFIQFDDNRGSGGEQNKLTISTQNDANDDIYLVASGSVFVSSATLYTNNISASNISCSSFQSNGNQFTTGSSSDRGNGNWLFFNSTNVGVNWYIGNNNTDGGNLTIFATNGSSRLAGVYLHYNNTGWSALSDERVKCDMNGIDNCLDSLLKLKPITYRYKSQVKLNVDKIHIGFTAQDLEKKLGKYRD